MPEALEELSKDIGKGKGRFLELTETHRPELYRYCRMLTSSPWDAEDLVQDTLLRAFAKLGEIFSDIENLKAYLFQIATRRWIDICRHKEPIWSSEASADPSSEDQTTSPVDFQEAAQTLLTSLPPQERMVLVLKDAFEFSLADISGFLGTSTGAIKSALHRARLKLQHIQDKPEAVAVNAQAVDPAVVMQFVEAFNARDFDALRNILLEGATGEIQGCCHEFGRDSMVDGSLAHTLSESGAPRAERRELFGEPVILIWYTYKKGNQDAEVIRDCVRLETSDGRISRLRYYYFCPETLKEIAGTLKVPLLDNGYRFSMTEKERTDLPEDFEG